MTGLTGLGLDTLQDSVHGMAKVAARDYEVAKTNQKIDQLNVKNRAAMIGTLTGLGQGVGDALDGEPNEDGSGGGNGGIGSLIGFGLGVLSSGSAF
jgi:hypothetical protein